MSSSRACLLTTYYISTISRSVAPPESGYLPGVVEAVKHKAGGTAMVLSKGVGITAGRRPMSAYRRKSGETHGQEWGLAPEP